MTVADREALSDQLERYRWMADQLKRACQMRHPLDEYPIELSAANALTVLCDMVEELHSREVRR